MATNPDCGFTTIAYVLKVSVKQISYLPSGIMISPFMFL